MALVSAPLRYEMIWLHIRFLSASVEPSGDLTHSHVVQSALFARQRSQFYRLVCRTLLRKHHTAQHRKRNSKKKMPKKKRKKQQKSTKTNDLEKGKIIFSTFSPSALVLFLSLAIFCVFFRWFGRLLFSILLFSAVVYKRAREEGWERKREKISALFNVRTSSICFVYHFHFHFHSIEIIIRAAFANSSHFCCCCSRVLMLIAWSPVSFSCVSFMSRRVAPTETNNFCRIFFSLTTNLRNIF